MKNKIEDLRNILFQTLENLIDPEEGQEVDLEKAKTICDIGKVLVDSAKVEVAFCKVTNSLGSGFIPNNKPELTSGEPIKKFPLFSEPE